MENLSLMNTLHVRRKLCTISAKRVCYVTLIFFTLLFLYIYNRYLSGNDVVTPTQLVTALKSYGGLENCIAELISLKRGRLNMLRQACSSLEKKVKRFIGRTNDIQFTYSDTFPLSPNVCHPDDAEEFLKVPSYSFVAFEYSGKQRHTYLVHRKYDTNNWFSMSSYRKWH